MKLRKRKLDFNGRALLGSMDWLKANSARKI
jgi:hypothetical protein